MRILVTGGAGYIGSHTVRLLAGPRARRLGLRQPRLRPSRRRAGRSADRRRPAATPTSSITRCLIQRIEAVVHFAAFALVGESVTDPAKYYQNNVVNTLTLLERMRRHGVKRLVFSSTCATYGTPDKVPITEDTPQRPINPYGRTKLMIEQALADYAAAYGWGCAALRYFNAAGASRRRHDRRGPRSGNAPDSAGDPGGDGEAAAHRGVRHRLSDARRHLHSRLHPRRRSGRGPCAGAREDRARRRSRAFNLGTGRGYSVREVIRTVEAVTGLPVPVKEGPRRAGDPAELVAAPAKAMKELGWRPTVSGVGANRRDGLELASHAS